MPSRTRVAPGSPLAPPSQGTHRAGSRPRCLPAPRAAAAASPALFSKLFPWPQLTPALGLSCSLLSSFSLEKSRNSADAEGAELIYAVGSPALLYTSPRSNFRDPRNCNPTPDGTEGIISPPFPSHQGTTSQLNAIQSGSQLLPLQDWELPLEMRDFFPGGKKFVPISILLIAFRKRVFPFGGAAAGMRRARMLREGMF